MIRACERCQWAEREPTESSEHLWCREGPEPMPVVVDHWCGRFRIAEGKTDDAV